MGAIDTLLLLAVGGGALAYVTNLGGFRDLIREIIRGDPCEEMRRSGPGCSPNPNSGFPRTWWWDERTQKCKCGDLAV